VTTRAAGVVPFRYGATQVRTILCGGSPWFVAVDVCAVLGLVKVDPLLRV